MPINQKIDIFIHFVRRAKKGVFAPLIIASIISVLLIIGGFSFFLFDFYSNLINNYYKNILYDVYDLQKRVISKDNYIKDLVALSKYISTRRGIKSVWIVDRNGKCLYHTDKRILEKYFGKNLPVDYYNNINVIWKFEKRHPFIIKNKIKFDRYRLSIPLYPFGKNYYDFILGVDVLFFPVNFSWIYLLIFIIVSIIISAGIVFFPLWYLTNKRFYEVSKQAMILGGTLKTEYREEKRSIETEKKFKEEAIFEKDVEREPIEKKEVKTEAAKTVEKPTAPPSKKPQKEETRIKEKLEKMEAENPNIRLLELKQSTFRRKKNELSKLIVESFPYHSGSVSGSYVTILEKGNIIWPLAYSYHDSYDIVKGYEIIKDIYDYLNSLLNSEAEIKVVCSKLNSMYVEKELKGDFTIIKISESGVEYTAMGNDYAVYLKEKDKVVKELSLGLPQLGEVKENLEAYIKVADIKFESGDIFIAMPSNARKINIDNGTMDILIRDYLNKYKSDYEKMSSELNNILKLSFKKDRKMEETGFISMKFL